MYADYFGLDEAPFAITPDPRYLYLGKRHAEALAHLLYGVREGGGFVLLTGEVGTGKTTLTRCLLDELPPEVDVAVLLNPRLDVTEFLEAICQELRIEVPDNAGNRRLVDALNRYLLDAHARGRRTVLIVDEAQNLSADVLEQVRLLTNLETAKTKLLQIMLIGQPELRDLLARPDLRQLAQRVTARYHLEPLACSELTEYVHHRLGIAGARAPLFGTSAMKTVWKLSDGIPRRANILCDRALLGAWSAGLREVTPRLVRQAAAEIRGPAQRKTIGVRATLFTALLLVAALAAIALQVRPALLTPASADADATPVPAAPTLAQWLATHAATAGTDDALARLFSEWQVDYSRTGGPACAQAAAAGLRCLHGRGTWRALTELDRPAVLELMSADGTRFQVALTALLDSAEGPAAQLHAGNAARRVTPAELGELWAGEFLALWQPPAGIEPPLLPGTRGAGISWLRNSLASLLQIPLDVDAADRYDESLVASVREFQRAEGLRVDGIAGEETLLRLNRRLREPGRPFLSGREN